jgi:hypothetical protein
MIWMQDLATALDLATLLENREVCHVICPEEEEEEEEVIVDVTHVGEKDTTGEDVDQVRSDYEMEGGEEVRDAAVETQSMSMEAPSSRTHVSSPSGPGKPYGKEKGPSIRRRSAENIPSTSIASRRLPMTAVIMAIVTLVIALVALLLPFIIHDDSSKTYK